jgi:hypothetical protein
MKDVLLVEVEINILGSNQWRRRSNRIFQSGSMEQHHMHHSGGMRQSSASDFHPAASVPALAASTPVSVSVSSCQSSVVTLRQCNNLCVRTPDYPFGG